MQTNLATRKPHTPRLQRLLERYSHVLRRTTAIFLRKERSTILPNPDTHFQRILELRFELMRSRPGVTLSRVPLQAEQTELT
jgi:hypothetical protein